MRRGGGDEGGFKRRGAARAGGGRGKGPGPRKPGGGRSLVAQRYGTGMLRPGDTRRLGPMQGQSSAAARPGVAGTGERHEALPADLRQSYETGLGADLGSVRVHAGDGVAEEFGADAVALGGDIHLRADAYQPGMGAGRRLLGHELAHTVQQGAVPAVATPERSGSTGEMETEADQAADAVERGERFSVAMATPRAPQFKVREAHTREHALGLDLDPERAQHDEPSSSEPAIEDPSERALTQAEAAPRPPKAAGAATASATMASADVSATPDSAGKAGAATPPTSASPANAASATPAQPPSPRVQASPPADAQAAGGATPEGAAVAPPPAAPVVRVAAPPAASQEHTAPALAAQAATVRSESTNQAAQVREAAARALARLEAGLTATQQRIRGVHRAQVAQLEAGHQSDLQILDAARAQASAVVQASKVGALQQLTAAEQQQQAEFRARAGQHRETATQAATQARASVAACGEAEAERASATSEARRVEVAQPNDEQTGDAARVDAQRKVDRELSRQAAQGLATDAAEMSSRARQAAGEFAATADEQLAAFLGQMDASVPSVLAATSSHSQASRAGIERAAADASAGIDALHAEVRARLEQDHAEAVSVLGAQTSANLQAAQSALQPARAELPAQSEELASAIEQQGADASDALGACASPAEANAAADAARAQSNQAGSQGVAAIGSIEQQQLTTLDACANAAESELGQLAQDARTAAQQTIAGASAALQRTGAEAERLMSEGCATAIGQMSEATASARAEIDQASGTFATELAGAAEQARGDIRGGVDAALAEQAANQAQTQSKKQQAQAQIGQKYDALRGEAESRSSSEQQSRRGQRGFWGSLVAGWNRLTSVVKRWFAAAFGDWLGGFLYGLLSTLASLAVVIGGLLLIAATGPIGLIVAVGLAVTLLVGSAGVGIYSRFQAFQAENGRSPGFGEGVLLTLLGIADITGVPQIVEGIAGRRAFSNGHTMTRFEAGENVGTGIAQLAAIIFGIRSLKGGRAKGNSSLSKSARREPTGFSGRKGFELKNGQPRRNNARVVNDRTYTGHALDQMQNRGIPLSVVENAIKHGTEFPGKTPNTVGFYDTINQIRVITNSQNGAVVTVIRGSL
ncbi:hypothetical protein Hoch_0795 [Haliangium ochraceum DSM 14365]|uniref:eCIS core domain-containing protein n=2 Tax=Haliangium ochraceum TaxID=80816 RepID=D0LN40_HALO1|nr:hypothetical protein Hoch_0795 [Haliangium ochraceum DSM 14365]